MSGNNASFSRPSVFEIHAFGTYAHLAVRYASIQSHLRAHLPYYPKTDPTPGHRPSSCFVHTNRTCLRNIFMRYISLYEDAFAVSVTAPHSGIVSSTPRLCGNFAFDYGDAPPILASNKSYDFTPWYRNITSLLITPRQRHDTDPGHPHPFMTRTHFFRQKIIYFWIQIISDFFFHNPFLYTNFSHFTCALQLPPPPAY